jgi:hypothetical protein
MIPYVLCRPAVRMAVSRCRSSSSASATNNSSLSNVSSAGSSVRDGFECHNFGVKLSNFRFEFCPGDKVIRQLFFEF